MSLFDLSLDELRTRTSVKWRAYPPDVLPLFVAEMDVTPPDAVIEAVHDAMLRGDTGYDHGPAYAEAFAELAERRYGWSPDPRTMSPVADVMTGVAEVLRLVTEPGDAVVVTPPVYPPFYAFVEHADRRVETAPLTAGHRLDLAALEAAFERAARASRRPALLLCQPHNPTGTVHTAEELAAVGELAHRHGVAVVADEIHAPLVLTGTFVPTTTVIPDAVALHSASKAFNLAGLRAAVAVPGPEAAATLARMPEIVGHGVQHVAVVAQVAAMREGDAWLDELLGDLRANATHLRARLDEQLPQAGWTPPAATYLAWIDLRDVVPDEDPSRRLVKDHRLAVNQGTTFGPQGAGHVRLNYATSTALLDEAVARLASLRTP
ncbi:MalY/PatB family protein [Cellulomonas massiliensis]|uniref:MalY/PatB family protein n=1 Tax=Cellulomonas massiliensis TaxID=1465811 RepID=UPI00031DD20E|nr:aminotransferase class I/II-fold pyridoxal phosphate-dependent enzyme [Cellulomonas massiliensis]